MNGKGLPLPKVFARFPGVLGMELRLRELGRVSALKEEDDEQRDYRSFRRCASRSIRLPRSVCIEELLVFVSQTTSLFLCLLAESKLRLDRLIFRYKSKKFGICDVLRSLRNEYLRFVVLKQLRVESHRIAVGLKPLGSTNNDW